MVDDLSPFPQLIVSGCVDNPFSMTAPQITHSNTLPNTNDDKGIIYAIDTKAGQSGSPVYIKDKDSIILAGIHKGYSSKDKLNIAVCITCDLIVVLKKWANEMKTSFEVGSVKSKESDQ